MLIRISIVISNSSKLILTSVGVLLGGKRMDSVISGQAHQGLN